MATNKRNFAPAITLSCCAFATAIAWCSVAEAKTGLAPVLYDSTMDPHLARTVEQAVLRDLRLRGVDPPPLMGP